MMKKENLKPTNPLIEKWKILYPPFKEGKNCNYIIGYTKDGIPVLNPGCIVCNSNCYHNRKFRVPDEDLEAWNDYQEKLEEYFFGDTDIDKKYVKKITR